MSLIKNILLTNLFIILIYLVYKTGLSKSSSFKANRIFLLTGLIASTILPWISPVMEFLRPVNNQWLSTVPLSAEISTLPVQTTMIQPVIGIQPLELALWVYLIIAALIVITSILLWTKLIISTRKAPVHRYDQLKVIEVNQRWSAFSVFHTVFYPKPFDPTLSETRLILEHELVHAHQLHTLDNILYGTYRLLFFFNPFIHLLHKELMITHEYLADRITSVSDLPGYSTALISHQFKVPHFILMHPFNQQSFLKRRLNMLSKNTPNHLAGWKYLLVLPLLGGMILGSSWNATAQDKNPKKSSQMAARVEKKLKEMGFEKTGTNTWTKDGISVMSTDSVSMDEINARLRKAEERKAVGMTGNGKEAFLEVEEMPTFQGGKIEDFRTWVQGQIKYPAEARVNKISGTVYISFVVDTTGRAVDLQIVRGAGPILDAEVIRAIKSAPLWTPGKQRGQLINVSFTIPVKFILDDQAVDPAKKDSASGRASAHKAQPAKSSVISETLNKGKITKRYISAGDIINRPDSSNTVMVEGTVEKTEEEYDFLIVEEMPKFQNGDIEDFVSWAQTNVRYPKKALEENKSGTVEVSFVVSNTGELTDIQITKSADPNLDEAVMKVVKSSPRWIPGKQRGKEVNVSFTIPIKFLLN